MKRIKRADHFLDVTSDVQIVHAHPPDDPFRIDDVCRAKRDFLRRVKDPESIAELLLVVGEHRKALVELGPAVLAAKLLLRDTLPIS